MIALRTAGPVFRGVVCLLSFAVFLGFILSSTREALAASGEIPEAEKAKEASVDFSDFLYVRNPIPGSIVEVDCGFERISERTESGRTVTHTNEVALVLNVAPTEWLNLSLGMPYQFLTVHPADGSGSMHGNNFGDLTAEAFAMLLRDPMRQLAVSVGMDVGFPTGSVRDGTGGQWTLLPFVNAGIMLGPVQVLADVDFVAELRTLPGAGQPKQELLFNLGVGYPIAAGILPFLTANSAYLTSATTS